MERRLKCQVIDSLDKSRLAAKEPTDGRRNHSRARMRYHKFLIGFIFEIAGRRCAQPFEQHVAVCADFSLSRFAVRFTPLSL